MRTRWLKNKDEVVWGDLSIEKDSLIFTKGDWPFKKKAWERPYSEIQRVGHASFELFSNTSYFAGDYTFKVELTDSDFAVFSLAGPGHFNAKNFIHRLRGKIQATK